MRFLDYLSSTRRPTPETPVLGGAAVRERILSLNRPTAPYQVRHGAVEHVDLVAEWKVLDESWSEIFSKAGMRRAFSIHMRLDEGRHNVRAIDYMRELSWEVGVRRARIQASWYRGQISETSFGRGYVFTENLSPTVAYDYRFQSAEIKSLLQEAVTSAGWTYKGIMFGRV